MSIVKVKGDCKGCCRDCTERHINCHATCEAYKEFRLQLDELNKKKKFDSFNRSSGWGYIPRRRKL